MFEIKNPKNEVIALQGQDAISILNEINFILISLHNMASYFYRDGNNLSDEERRKYEQATTLFIDECKVTQRLAEARGLLAQQFDSTLGDDDMDDLERAAERIQYWTAPKKPI